MYYKDIESAKELGKTLILVPIKDWENYLKIREDYYILKQGTKVRYK